MALLRVPLLLGTQKDSNAPGSRHCQASPFKLHLHRPARICGYGDHFVVASIKEIHKRYDRRPEPSADTKKKHIPPWRTPWTPFRKRSSLRAPTRDWSDRQRYLRRKGGRHDEDEEGEKGKRIAESPAPNRTAMARIIEKLRELEKTLEPANGTDQVKPQNAGVEEHVRAPLETLRLRTAGELFLPRPNQDIFSIGNYWSTPDHPVPAPGRGLPDTKFPWEFEEDSRDKEEERRNRISAPTLAELIIAPKQLKKLRTDGIALEKQITIGRLGVTDNIAEKIIGQWHNSEVVKVRCGGPAATNMMKIHKDLERKTGGLVIWRSGGVAIVYRGDDYDTINKAATSLKHKLDGLLTSQKPSDRFSGNLSHSKEIGASLGLANGEPIDLGASVGAIPPQSNESKICLNRDSIQSGRPANGIVQVVLPISYDEDRPRDAKADVKVDTPSMEPPNPQSHDLQRGFESTHVEQCDFIGNDDSQSQSRVLHWPRPNIYPDPFVDRDYELELDSLLETLGPRCKDWTGPTPVPVDADLLPPLVPDYKPPYRLLPYGVRSQLTNYEQTDLRRLIRHIAPHFVLGRNEGHQGLAAAILKLWEKSEVVKIAVKAGVQNLSNYKMAEELKQLTGGVLLSRDRFFITIYRGKDFLPLPIAFAITERTGMLRKLKAGDELIEGGISTIKCSGMDGPCAEEIRCEAERDLLKKVEAEKAKRNTLMKDLEEKLELALEKKHKAEQDLEMIEPTLKPVDKIDDSEPLTEEEKYMFRRLGLKMQQFLLVGRRGVFDGVVENMHLHWKHRELVKLVVKERDPVQLQKTAKLLESESGGVLVAVESISKGQAIIVYRGKNYHCPKSLRPQTLLNKKMALERSLEMQRRESLTSRISALEKEIAKLKASLSVSETTKSALLDVALDEFGNTLSDKENVSPENMPSYTDSTGGLANEMSEEEKLSLSICSDKQDLLNLAKLGPIYRATRLSNLERLKLRKLALKLGVGSRFHVGKSNGMVGLCRAIRIHFLKHSLVLVGIKQRGQGTSAQDVVHELEDLTGGVIVSQEENQVILYRGWPKGEKMPISGSVKQVSPELLAALEAEDEEDDMAVSPSLLCMSNGISFDDDIPETDNDHDNRADYQLLMETSGDAFDDDDAEKTFKNRLFAKFQG